MTSFEDSCHCLAPIAGSARRQRDLFITRDALIGELLDRPLACSTWRNGVGFTSRSRAAIGQGGTLTIGTGLEAAFGDEWFAHEPWGAWSRAQRASLSLVLGRDVTLPAVIGLEFCALIADAQTRRARLSSPTRVVGSAEFVKSGVVVFVEIEITEGDLSASRQLDLVVEVDNLVSPAAANGSADERPLGLGLTRISAGGAIEATTPNVVPQRRSNVFQRAVARLKGWGLARAART